MRRLLVFETALANSIWKRTAFLLCSVHKQTSRVMSNTLRIRFPLQTQTVFLTEGLGPARAIKKWIKNQAEQTPQPDPRLIPRPLPKQNQGCCSGTQHGLRTSGQTEEEHIFHSNPCNKQWQRIDCETLKSDSGLFRHSLLGKKLNSPMPG